MDSRVKKALKFIEEKLNTNISLKTITKYCCFGASRFCELFKKETGMSFKAYLKRRRVEEAKKLLKDDSLSIKQISYRVGYKFIQNFCRHFKEITHYTPSEYRARCRIGNFDNKIGNSDNKNS